MYISVMTRSSAFVQGTCTQPSYQQNTVTDNQIPNSKHSTVPRFDWSTKNIYDLENLEKILFYFENTQDTTIDVKWSA